MSDTAFAAAVTAPARHLLRAFATPADEPRARRPSDVTRLVVALFALAATSAAAVPPPGFTRAVARLAAAVPGFLDVVSEVALDATTALALALVVVAVVRRRLAVARDLLLAGGVTVGVCAVAGRAGLGSWSDVWAALWADGPPEWYPSLRVALPGALLLTASPHLVLPLRRAGRWTLGVATVGAVVLDTTSPLGAIAGLLTAVAVAAAIHLAFGSSAGRPGLDEIDAALRELGVVATDLVVAEHHEAGLVLVRGRTEGGMPIEVKVYGRDAHDSALMATLWRAIWYREPGSPLRVGRLQQVEHEAFLTLLARQAGVATDTVVTAGATTVDDALLVLAVAGEQHELPASDATVAELWRLVATLHRAGIGHGTIGRRHLFATADGTLGIHSFRGATVAPTPGRRQRDVV